MKKILLLFIIIFLSISSKAQLSYQWANSAGSTNAEYGQAIASDPSGNVYVTGAFIGTVDFDPSIATANLTSLSGSQDIFLAKYTSAGAFIWVKQIAGNSTEKPYDLVADASGAYLAGNFLGTVDFDPNAGTNNITFLGGGTDGDGFFAKYDINGNLSWVNRIGSTVNDRVTSIAIDAFANVYVTGFIGGNADMDPSASSASLNVSGTYNAYIGKYSSTGAYVFAKQITGGYSEGDDINVDASGNIYLTGSYATTNDFDPSAATANLSTSSLTQLDIFLAKYTSAGLYTFAKQIGGIGVDIGYQVVPDASGNIYLGGVFSSTCDFDPTATVNSLTSAGQGDLFVAKYDASGNLTWKTGTGGTTNDYCFGLGLDGSNNVYITGKVQGTNVDFDPSASSSLLTSASSCMYIASFSSAGSFLSLSSPSIASVGNGLCVNSSLYVAGMFAGTGDFDFSASTANLTSLGGNDVFFAKYNVCAGSAPAQPSAISGNISPCIGNSQTYSVTNDPLATSYTWSFPVNWAGSSTTNVSTPTVSNSGVISVVATNSCGAGPSRTLNITAVGFSNAVITSTNISCYNYSNGIAVISYTGSGGPYSILWQPSGAVTASVNNLSVGTHSATVTDGNGCSITKTVSITQPLQLLAGVTTTNVNCFASCNGAAIASFTNNIGPVTYSWQPISAIAASVNNLCAGIYTLLVTDQNNCFSNIAFTIIQAPPINVAVGSITNVACSGQFNGAAQILASGGTPSYTYSWSPSAQTNSVLTGVGAGIYTCSVTDANGCVNTKTVNITQPSPLLITTNTVVPNNCFSFATGQINTSITGGTPTYSITWTPSLPSTSTVTNLAAGSYTYMVLDAKGCVTYSIYTLTDPPALALIYTTTTVACSGPNGSAACGIAGGTPPYTFSWSPTSQTTSIATGLLAGNYVSTTTDANGCIINASITVPVGVNPSVTATSNSSVICTGQTATLTANGASTYSWNTTVTAPSITVNPTANTTYTVTGFSSNGCAASATITQLVDLCTGINMRENANAFVKIYPNPFSSEITISIIDSDNKTDLTIYNSMGQLVYKTELNEINSMLKLEQLPAGIYFLNICNIVQKQTFKLVKE